MSNAPKVFQTLYGKSDDYARTAANATAKAHIGAGAQRQQEVYTPQPLVDCLLRLWPEGIALDPCSGPESIVPAERKLYGTQRSTGRKGKKGEIFEWVGPGMEEPAVPRTYYNTPYKNLKQWLAEAIIPGIETSEGELVCLFPFRTQRSWIREYLSLCTAVCLLDPFEFIGFDQGAPFALALSYHGERDFKGATEGLGDVCRMEFL